MLPKWTDSVIDGLQSVISGFNPVTSKSESGPAGHDDNNHNHNHSRAHKSPSAASHASRSTRSWAQMLTSRSTTQRKSNSVKDFLNLHDNAECDPIAIESDEDDNHSRHIPRKPSSHLPNQARPRTVLTRSESREEKKLLRTLSYDTTASERPKPAETHLRHREPDATGIPDPMKKASFSGGHRPVNTLDGPSMSSRSEFYRLKTHPHRGNQQPHPPKGLKPNDELRANDHAIPNKKSKTGHPTRSGTISTSVSRLDKGQRIDDSPDELQLSPASNDGTRTVGRSQKYQFRDIRNGSEIASKRVVAVEVPRQVSPSPENEDDFTKSSARQRKAEKDQILGSSSPNPIEEHPEQTVSPYFTKPKPLSAMQRKIQHQDTQRSLVEEGADDLHTSVRPSSNKPYKDLTGQEMHDRLFAGNTESTTISKPARGRPKKANSPSVSISLKEAVYPGLADSDDYIVQVAPGLRQFSISLEDSLLSNDPILTPFPISKIVQFRYDNECIACIEFSRTEDLKTPMYLTFSSKESASTFITLLQQASSSLKVQPKDEQWMATALTRARESLANSSVHFENQSMKPEDLVPGQFSSSKVMKTEKRSRLIDRLDAPTPTPRTSTIISGLERSSGAQPEIAVEIPRAQNEPVSQQAVPQRQVESAQHGGLQRRTRRSQKVDGTDRLKLLEAEETPKTPLSATGALGPPWSRDLVYPKPGKRSATVPFEDLSRLDDDEFLNDNLISFFMQYLETFMETNRPELYKRTYFFNSYFFERLTKNVKGRGINFDAVSRWTKAIDIFNRDFVVVPVNENLHWYLAIICNLQNLRSPSGYGAGEVVDATLDPEVEVQSQDEPTKNITQVRSDVVTGLEDHTEAPTEKTQQSLADLTISDNELSVTEIPPSYPKKGSTKRKQFRRSLPKYALDKPVIITLDSLGASRSGTCSILKNYIVAEGKDKRGLDIDVSAIQGMTAKGIPTQSNFSDCGLYLCMYLEQFVADPNNFVGRILQRQESAQLWPNKIRSEDLRARLRGLILEVHRRQEKQKSDYELPEVGGIMIRRRDHSPGLEGDKRPRTKKDVEQAKERFAGLTQTRLQPASAQTLEALPDQQAENKDQLPTQGLNSNYKMTTGVSPRSLRSHQPTRHSLKQHVMNEHNENDTRNSCMEVPDSAPLIDGPTTARPPHRTPAELVANLHHQDEEREDYKRRRLSAHNVHKRSDSASTEFLTGLESWAQSDLPNAASRDRDSDKMNNQGEGIGIEVKASPELQGPQGPDGGLSNDRADRKRKRHARQTYRDLRPTGYLEIPGTQNSEHGQKGGHNDVKHQRRKRYQSEMQGSIELGTRQDNSTQSPRQNQTALEIYEDSEIEKDAGDEVDVDGEMLLQ